jgi:hypothetical protein
MNLFFWLFNCNRENEEKASSFYLFKLGGKSYNTRQAIFGPFFKKKIVILV